jgi:hypothetical protein
MINKYIVNTTSQLLHYGINSTPQNKVTKLYKVGFIHLHSLSMGVFANLHEFPFNSHASLQDATSQPTSMH